MTKEMTVAEVLDGAADLLEKPGAWTTDVCARDAEGNPTEWFQDDAICFCALGAIFRAGGGSSSVSADDFFCTFLGGNGWSKVSTWNDDANRTQAEVVAKLREAAALAREQQDG